MRVLWAATAAASMLLGTGAAAQEASGPYAGFSVGSFRYTERASPTSAKIKDSTSVRRILGGYRFSPRMSLEASYSKTGDIVSSVTLDEPGFGPTTYATTADYETITVRLMGTKPFGRFALFGGVGIYESDLDETGRFQDELTEATYRYHEEDRGLNLLGGVQFDLRRISVRAELEWQDADEFGADRNVGVWSTGCSVLFKF